MSWISKNYEKASLAAGAVIALGLIFSGWQKYSLAEEDFSAEAIGSGSNDPSVKDSDKVATAKASFELPREWLQGQDDGRPVDLFTGVALFVNKNNPNNPVDLIKGDMVHPPIPNQWWLDHRIDPGFGDSPQRDGDLDGFSNIEEFMAKSDPNDPEDYPNLISKLTYLGEESVEWVLRPGFRAGEAFTFKYSDDLRQANKAGATNPVPVGELFFSEGAAKGRFKLLGSEIRREMNEAIRSEVDVTYVRVEDQKPNKMGTIYEIPAQFREGDARMFSYFDRSAILSLDALGLAGKKFKVEENTTFSLPPGGNAMNYKLIDVTPEQIIVEVTDKDGNKKTHPIAKGVVGSVAN